MLPQTCRPVGSWSDQRGWEWVSVRPQTGHEDVEIGNNGCGARSGSAPDSDECARRSGPSCPSGRLVLQIRPDGLCSFGKSKTRIHGGGARVGQRRGLSIELERRSVNRKSSIGERRGKMSRFAGSLRGIAQRLEQHDPLSPGNELRWRSSDRHAPHGSQRLIDVERRTKPLLFAQNTREPHQRSRANGGRTSLCDPLVGGGRTLKIVALKFQYFGVCENRRSDGLVRANVWLVRKPDAQLLDYPITIKDDERRVAGGSAERPSAAC